MIGALILVGTWNVVGAMGWLFYTRRRREPFWDFGAGALSIWNGVLALGGKIIALFLV